MSCDDPTPPTLVYYDGWCSVCIKSAHYIKRLDRQRGLVECVDIRSHDPRLQLVTIDQDQLATSLHARTPDGTLSSGTDAIRVIAAATGRGWQTSWTRFPIIRPIVDLCYRVFARNRLRWFATHQCKDGVCPVPPTPADDQARTN